MTAAVAIAYALAATLTGAAAGLLGLNWRTLAHPRLPVATPRPTRRRR